MFLICFILAVIIGIGIIHISEYSGAEDIAVHFPILFLLILLLSVLLAFASKAVQVTSIISMIAGALVTGIIIARRDYGHLFR